MKDSFQLSLLDNEQTVVPFFKIANTEEGGILDGKNDLFNFSFEHIVELPKGEANRLLQRYSFARVGCKGVAVISETSVIEVKAWLGHRR